MNYNEARDIIIDRVKPVSSEKIALSESGGRISAQNITAKINVPPFDRSPYDGYAFIAEDTPAKLQIIEEISAGSVPSFPVKSGQAAKIMTGAMIPEGADSVITYEDTEFTDSEVIINQVCKSGKNIIRAGEDVKIGDTLLHAGDFIDAGRAGLAASQGITQLEVYRQPVIGLISTGSELQEAGELQEGKIYNTSRYSFESALKLSGFTPKFIGITKDDENEIA
ncbi:MAG: molybdopterin molybdotransferase MoeA, partial [Synergistaceae bacterium]|nr:molybdopterin molybdotransferase MoeA [Synergistaceae bacterium]